MSSSEQRRRTGWLSAVRCFDEEELLVREKAHDCGMSTDQFMLSAALQRQTRSRIDSHIINELRRLGGLQKHLFSQGGGSLSREYANVLVEIAEAIKRIGA
ncbi:TPA: plasmid mobilization protein MobA [Pseudomonas aeruginosa]|uniref:plasmid mobilization protein MobA n=1 Tax=Pseudomonas aeruginosa TaxID=287 RepID=UPI0004F3A9FD|nr:plasmid mobilization protein MobA [Pseudomonas aeruginosa]AZZ15203.1 mobilization protein [Pseudomonas aeruginosa]KSH40043.1 mobilization protein [Pseudomonas aeruginosa]KSJ33147.1 mobilization protein [Pseudomonas aeruginosa]MBG5166211.1 mobilization protein [Pseudomonas aeruginosa]MBO3774357.1 mobilization protein [Pseudomonas aeruginosa]